MTANPNVWRVTEASDIATHGAPYIQQKASSDRISVVADPVGARGNVVQLFRDTGDALVNSGRRVEIARDTFSSEYDFITGGGFYWTSYMLGGEWIDAVESGALDLTDPATDNKSAIIKQFHPKTAGTHPLWAIQVNQYGVRLVKNAIDDSDDHTAHATWPLDQWVWHDIVFGIVWYSDKEGKFSCFLDGNLIYQEIGPQCYATSTNGLWFSEGIYVPGAERLVDRLTIYTQGYAQVYPGSGYQSLVGALPKNTRQPTDSRSGISRGALSRDAITRSSSAVDVTI